MAGGDRGGKGGEGGGQATCVPSGRAALAVKASLAARGRFGGGEGKEDADEIVNGGGTKITEKLCTACGEEREEAGFSKKQWRKRSATGRCKACTVHEGNPTGRSGGGTGKLTSPRGSLGYSHDDGPGGMGDGEGDGDGVGGTRKGVFAKTTPPSWGRGNGSIRGSSGESRRGGSQGGELGVISLNGFHLPTDWKVEFRLRKGGNKAGGMDRIFLSPCGQKTCRTLPEVQRWMETVGAKVDGQWMKQRPSKQKSPKQSPKTKKGAKGQVGGSPRFAKSSSSSSSSPSPKRPWGDSVKSPKRPWATGSKAKPVEGRRSDSTNEDDWVQYYSQTEAGRRCGINVGSVSQVVSGKQAKAGGYVFRYARHTSGDEAGSTEERRCLKCHAIDHDQRTCPVLGKGKGGTEVCISVEEAGKREAHARGDNARRAFPAGREAAL